MRVRLQRLLLLPLAPQEVAQCQPQHRQLLSSPHLPSSLSLQRHSAHQVVVRQRAAALRLVHATQSEVPAVIAGIGANRALVAGGRRLGVLQVHVPVRESTPPRLLVSQQQPRRAARRLLRRLGHAQHRLLVLSQHAPVGALHQRQGRQQRVLTGKRLVESAQSRGIALEVEEITGERDEGVGVGAREGGRCGERVQGLFEGSEH